MARAVVVSPWRWATTSWRPGSASIAAARARTSASSGREVGVVDEHGERRRLGERGAERRPGRVDERVGVGGARRRLRPARASALGEQRIGQRPPVARRLGRSGRRAWCLPRASHATSQAAVAAGPVPSHRVVDRLDVVAVRDRARRRRSSRRGTRATPAARGAPRRRRPRRRRGTPGRPRGSAPGRRGGTRGSRHRSSGGRARRTGSRCRSRWRASCSMIRRPPSGARTTS